MDALLSLLDGPKVALEDILDAKEARVERQQKLLKQHHQTLVSLTVNIPGPVKKSSASEYLFNTAIEICLSKFKNLEWQVVEQAHFISNCGYEMLFVINQEAKKVKQECIKIEMNHPLGRMWDIDVITSDGNILSRKEQGDFVRRCFICTKEAHVCARSRAHSVEELTHHIESIINRFYLQDNLSLK